MGIQDLRGLHVDFRDLLNLTLADTIKGETC